MLSTFVSPVQCCFICRLRIADCVCAIAPRLNITTRVIVVIHAKEWRRSSNTGYLAQLALKAAEVRQHGMRHQTIDSTGIGTVPSATLALYPGRGAIPLTAELLANLPRPLTLLVPDGNWMQAKNMMRRVPMLACAQPVRLDGPSLGLACLRRNAYPDRMSTFEAIAQALGIIENQTTANTMLDFFQRIVPHMAISKQRATKLYQ